MNILVTGATGTVGGHVVAGLLDRDHSVKVIVRDRGKATFPEAVEVIEGDLTDADALRRALSGVERAFLNMADDNGAAFAAAARDADVEHVVLLSSFTVDVPLASGDDNVIAMRHRAGEQALERAGVPATFLRSSGFDYNILQWTSAISEGIVRAPFLDVALPKVHPGDIGRAAAAVLLEAAPVPGVYVITGPERITMREEIAIVGELLDRLLEAEELSFEDAMAAFPEGTPELVRRSVVETQDKEASVLAPTDDLERLTGMRARSFREWATENLRAFGPALSPDSQAA